MRYRKVNPLTINTNSERNLILRQQFALAFLKLDLSKKTIINIDETWLGMADFRRRKWALPKSTNSVERALIQPRISMIAALYSDGKVWLSLVQSNSNSRIMSAYLHTLIKKLDAERKDWRSDVVFMLDNAPYHRS